MRCTIYDIIYQSYSKTSILVRPHKKALLKTASWDLFRKLAFLVPENVVYVRSAKTEKISIFKYPDARYHVDA